MTYFQSSKERPSSALDSLRSDLNPLQSPCRLCRTKPLFVSGPKATLWIVPLFENAIDVVKPYYWDMAHNMVLTAGQAHAWNLTKDTYHATCVSGKPIHGKPGSGFAQRQPAEFSQKPSLFRRESTATLPDIPGPGKAAEQISIQMPVELPPMPRPAGQSSSRADIPVPQFPSDSPVAVPKDEQLAEIAQTPSMQLQHAPPAFLADSGLKTETGRDSTRFDSFAAKASITNAAHQQMETSAPLVVSALPDWDSSRFDDWSDHDTGPIGANIDRPYVADVIDNAMRQIKALDGLTNIPDIIQINGKPWTEIKGLIEDGSRLVEKIAAKLRSLEGMLLMCKNDTTMDHESKMECLSQVLDQPNELKTHLCTLVLDVEKHLKQFLQLPDNQQLNDLRLGASGLDGALDFVGQVCEIEERLDALNGCTAGGGTMFLNHISHGAPLSSLFKACRLRFRHGSMSDPLPIQHLREILAKICMSDLRCQVRDFQQHKSTDPY